MAKRRSKRERAMEGMIVGIKYGIEVERVMVEEGMEGLVAIEIKLGRERCRLVGVYINRDLQRN